MVDSIGSGGASRATLDTLLRKMQEKKAQLAGLDTPAAGAGEAAGGGFAEAVSKSISEVDTAVKDAESLHIETLKGNVDFHEVAARIKESELSFDFTMQVRNKFIEAYREVMRMNV
ncbi:MAG: flagellar hook-basal body complex protein FliE [bacterium]|nr:flagellar hook-basal body complex protein FliE [bacterium]